ncbi:hypothetical protein [Azospirillum sp. INR13]|uniref:hypothetical protein n=1 Tax=Azospirillum sp. INR13 TaxID=2596919 RepID=UPI0021060961|nr:hypothetical protein [Azospirillum sp. INR13]
MHVIYQMIKNGGGGRIDGAKAVDSVKGMSWESPRGPLTIDPNSRHVTQTIYLRTVEKIDGKLENVEKEAFPNQPDYGYKVGK